MNSVLEREKFTTKDLVLCGILMALTTIMTMVIQIPVVGTHGYVNMGDTVVLFSALYLGKKKGAVIGGVGSALADIISGYAVYAPITFITKGLEGFICGYIHEKMEGNKAKYVSTIVGGVIMVTGYFIGEIFMYGVKVSALAIGPNSVQAAFGIITALLIYSGVKRTIGK